MRQNLIIALLSVIATLLAVKVFTDRSQIVYGQVGGGGTASIGSEIAIATGSLAGGNGSSLYLYDTTKKKLLCYYLGNTGLEVRAVRDIHFDLEALDYNGKPGVVVPVKVMKREIEKAAKAAAAKAGKDEE
jgi:hypothetical protein